jgi:hypothetical protein
MTRTLFVALAWAAAGAAPSLAHAQVVATPTPGEATAVFLDCHTRLCDFDHLRRTIPVVNWVRDRQDADVHVLVTDERTGSGGTRYTFAFLGLRAFAGREYTVEYVTSPDNTYEEDRAGFTRVLQLALGPYIAETPGAHRVTIGFAAPATDVPTPALTPQADPWDFWVFRIGVNGGMNGESQERFFRGNASISANRITEGFKFSFRARTRGHRSEFDVIDSTVTPILDTTFVSTFESYSLETLAAWSLGPHWSWGILAEVDRNSSLNWDFAFRGGPAVEYDIFPYEESTRRIITFRYVAGLTAFNYRDTTIFFETAEILPAHVLEVELGITEPWGGIHAGLEAFQYLHDLRRHSIGVGGGFSIRLVRGLDFNMGGNVSRIKDQLYLPKEDLSPEQVLLQQRQRGTDFRFGLNIGLGFRFGSKFNNVVNPRMR